jgi:hypothetical protein
MFVCFNSHLMSGRPAENGTFFMMAVHVVVA